MQAHPCIYCRNMVAGDDRSPICGRCMIEKLAFEMRHSGRCYVAPKPATQAAGSES